MSLFLATSFSAASCSDDDDDPAGDNSIVGTWICFADDLSLTVQFNPDKTGSLIVSEDGTSLSLTERFEYDYQPEKRDLVIIGSMLDGHYEVALAGKSLRLTNGYEGIYYQFTRK